MATLNPVIKTDPRSPNQAGSWATLIGLRGSPNYLPDSSESTTLKGSLFSVLPGVLTYNLPCTSLPIYLINEQQLPLTIWVCAKILLPLVKFSQLPGSFLWPPVLTLRYHITSYNPFAFLFVSPQSAPSFNLLQHKDCVLFTFLSSVPTTVPSTQ